MRTLPKGPERLYCEIGMLAFWVPSFWKILEAMEKIQKCIDKLSEIGPYPREWADDEWRRNKIWLRTFSKGSRALTP